jgi:LysR family glycine cleavage system transcriptional activator
MKQAAPPFPAIRAFEAAGRLLSFTQAAAELGVTQAAISRQIRALEDFLQQKLFLRLTRRVELTEAGRVYLAAVQRGFAEIEDTTQLLIGRGARRVITLSAFPTISFLWLMPRLGSFSALYPNLEIRVVVSDPPFELQPGQIDARIGVGRLPGRTYGPEQPRIGYDITANWHGIRADLLFEEWLVPVIAARLVEHKPRLHHAAELRQFPLIHTAARPYAWHDWLRASGAPRHRSKADLHVSHLFIALQLAREGKGVALVPSTTLASYEARDALQCLLPPTIRSAGEYYLLTHEEGRQRAELQVFAKWLLGEAKALAARAAAIASEAER